MTDPLGLIQPNRGPHPLGPSRPVTGPGAGQQAQGPNDVPFKDVLMKQIQQVSDMQAEAEQAVEDLNTGRRDDMAQVLMAQEKADMAFQMLLQVRNKVMDAYEEVKQIRV